MKAARIIKVLDGSERLLNLVDFKWLMAGTGWWVDLSRLQSDQAYIGECLQRALATDSELLRMHSVEMLGIFMDAEVALENKRDHDDHPGCPSFCPKEKRIGPANCKRLITAFLQVQLNIQLSSDFVRR